MLSVTKHQGNTDLSPSGLSPHTSEWLVSKLQEITSVGEDVEEQGTLVDLLGIYKLVQPL